MHEPAVTAADLTRRIAERSARVGIIGQGYVGLPLAVEFARVGFTVTGFDTSLDHVTTLNAGRSRPCGRDWTPAVTRRRPISRPSPSATR